MTDDDDDREPRTGSEPDPGRDAASRRDDVRRAAAAVADGELVVYPTETVYGLGGDALDPDAVERVFDLKGRDRSNPLSLGVASVDDALRYTRPTELAVAFARAFLPGPVTVVVERDDRVPDALTAGRDRCREELPGGGCDAHGDSMAWILFIVGGVLLFAGAEWLVRGGGRLARRLGVSTLVTGLAVAVGSAGFEFDSLSTEIRSFDEPTTEEPPTAAGEVSD
jgi:hypothetical protein